MIKQPVIRRYDHRREDALDYLRRHGPSLERDVCSEDLAKSMVLLGWVTRESGFGGGPTGSRQSVLTITKAGLKELHSPTVPLRVVTSKQREVLERLLHDGATPERELCSRPLGRKLSDLGWIKRRPGHSPGWIYPGTPTMLSITSKGKRVLQKSRTEWHDMKKRR